MATNPHPVPTPEKQPLSTAESWELFESLRGILKETYQQLGGAQEFHRQDREEWNRSFSRLG